MTGRAVVVGSGRAGRRHAIALRARLPTAEIVVVRRHGSEQPLEPLDRIGATVVPTLEHALIQRPDVAIVASPATHHVEPALHFIEGSTPVLVEKPLAATSSDGESLRRAAARTATPVVVGYHLRHSETPLAVRRALRDGVIGEVVHAELDVGQHLDQWRPGSDPRRSVTARRELGGGVLLELSHELDALHWFLGPTSTVLAILRTDGAPTDGAVETVADLETSSARGTTASVHLDMVSRVPRRRWRFLGTQGELTADLLTGEVHLEGARPRVLHRSAHGERDRAELALIDSLLASAGMATRDDDVGERSSIDEAVHVLAVIEAARRSSSTGSTVPVTPSPAGVH